MPADLPAGSPTWTRRLRREPDELGRRHTLRRVLQLVRMECLVKPLRDGDVVLQKRYERLASRFVLLPMGAAAFDQAAVLRARFGLRTPDALHLACAQLNDCTALWTNDRRLDTAARGLSTAIVED